MLRLLRFRRWLLAISCLCNLIVWECSPTLWSQEPASPKPAEQSSAGGGYGGEGPGAQAGIAGGYGGEGGGYGGGMMGGSGLPLKLMILEGDNEAGNERMKVRTASRVLRFSYQLSSLKPQDANTGYGGGMYGGGGYGGESGGYGGEGGYGGRGYAGDMYGGGMGIGGPGMMGRPGMGGYGGMGGGITTGVPAGTKSSQQPVITIWAYVFDQDKENNRTKIELLIYPPPKFQTGSGAMPAGGAGMGSGAMGAGMEMGDMEGAGMGMASIPRFVRLATLVGPPKGPQDKYHLTQAEFKIVANTIKQKIWKADLVKQLNAEQGNAAETEQFLKQLLTEEYETQLARQEIEVESIQQRITQLKEEITRRRAAKDRVIDVQLGRIVLEAQGLLGK